VQKRRNVIRLTLTGVGAMNSPRFAPAGLLIEHGHHRVMVFAEAAGWHRPTRFARGVGGHASAMMVALEAKNHGVKRLGILPHRAPYNTRDGSRANTPVRRVRF